MSIITILLGVQSVHVVDCSGGDSTFNLPAITVLNDGVAHVFKRVDNNYAFVAMVQAAGNDAIEDSGQSRSLPNKYDAFTLFADNTYKTWWLLSEAAV